MRIESRHFFSTGLNTAEKRIMQAVDKGNSMNIDAILFAPTGIWKPPVVSDAQAHRVTDLDDCADEGEVI